MPSSKANANEQKSGLRSFINSYITTEDLETLSNKSALDSLKNTFFSIYSSKPDVSQNWANGFNASMGLDTAKPKADILEKIWNVGKTPFIAIFNTIRIFTEYLPKAAKELAEVGLAKATVGLEKSEGIVTKFLSGAAIALLTAVHFVTNALYQSGAYFTDFSTESNSANSKHESVKPQPEKTETKEHGERHKVSYKTKKQISQDGERFIRMMHPTQTPQTNAVTAFQRNLTTAQLVSKHGVMVQNANGNKVDELAKQAVSEAPAQSTLRQP